MARLGSGFLAGFDAQNPVLGCVEQGCPRGELSEEMLFDDDRKATERGAASAREVPFEAIEDGAPADVVEFRRPIVYSTHTRPKFRLHQKRRRRRRGAIIGQF